MLTQEGIDLTVARISLMPFFPSSDPGARGTVSKEIADMASSDEQVKWLGHRFLQLYPKQWPGIVELRACFCKRFKPADGVHVESAVYFNQGYPSEADLGPIPGLLLEPTRSEREAIEAAGIPATRQLEAGEFTVDPDLAEEVHRLATAKAMPVVEKRSLAEIELALYGPRITPEEVERARAAELERRQKAAQ